MRSEEEVRQLYKQYVYKYADATLNSNDTSANQYFGAAVACGRTLGKDVKRIYKDMTIAKEFLKRRRANQ